MRIRLPLLRWATALGLISLGLSAQLAADAEQFFPVCTLSEGPAQDAHDEGFSYRPIEPGKYLGIAEEFTKWPRGRIRWAYNPKGQPEHIDAQTVIDIAIDASAQWAAVAGIQFEYTGIRRDAEVLNGHDGIVAVGWTTPTQKNGVGWAARGGPSYGGNIREWGYRPTKDGGIELNTRASGFAPDRSDPERRLRLYGSLLHELGHVIGLGHSDDPQSIMFANPYNGFNVLADDDIQAAADLYGHGLLYEMSPSAPEIPRSAFRRQFGTRVTKKNGDELRSVVVHESQRWLPWTKRSVDPDLIRFTINCRDDAPSKTVSVELLDAGLRMITTQAWSLGVCSTDDCAECHLDGPVPTASVGLIPGQKTLRIYVDDVPEAQYSFDVVSEISRNRLPDFSLSVDAPVIRRNEPVKLTLAFGADPEKDEMIVTWHVPGQQPVTQHTNGKRGKLEQTVSFEDAGLHEVVVSITDNVRRYGDIEQESAGPGFRRVLRQGVLVVAGG